MTTKQQVAKLIKFYEERIKIADKTEWDFFSIPESIRIGLCLAARRCIRIGYAGFILEIQPDGPLNNFWWDIAIIYNTRIENMQAVLTRYFYLQLIYKTL